MKRVDSGADYDVELTLELARVAREPSLEDKQRVLEALQVRLGDMPSFPSAGESTTGVRLVVPQVSSSTLAARASKFARSLVASKAALHLLWVGAAAGALGFWAGVHLNEPEAPPAPRQESRSARASGALETPAVAPESTPAMGSAPVEPSVIDSTESDSVESAPAPVAAAPAGVEPPRGEALPQPPVEPARSATPPALDAAPKPAPRAAPVSPARRAPDSTSARRGIERAGASPAPALAESARFLEAVRLLRRSQRALDAGEPAFALVLLEELDARFPPALLSEERETALIVALCKSGEWERAKRLTVELAARSPTSIYAARITRSCGNFGVR